MNQVDIRQQRVMQLASQSDGQPWICTVYFVLYEGSFYWLSFPERRHSQEIARSSKAALAVAIKTEPPVIGIQAEGRVIVVESLPEAEAVLQKYIEKYNQGRDFIKRLRLGTNHHVLYRMTPRRVIRFDELNQPENPYQAITL